MGAQNALELMRFGRLSPREGTPFEIAHADRTYRLRHYGADLSAPRRIPQPLLLVPPLMVSSEVYDVAPDISSVASLRSQGIDVWLVDFGAPELEEGGMERTLDDHVRAVADAVARVRSATGHDVHLAGYSQGGMFVYQAAAYVRCQGIASLVTFGSPVDIHRNLPGVSPGALEPLIRAATTIVDRPLEKIEGLPGFLTSTGFKLLSVRKEVEQIAEFWKKIHDRDALVRRESRRRFLGGEGFVAWPGPALRKFLDEFVVHNRLVGGGFVIDGQTITLADIDVPILCFVGTRDEIARGPAIAAIREAAPKAEVYEIKLPAGHFGLVVGSMAIQKTWPTVVDWIHWRERMGPRPALIPAPKPKVELDPEDAELGTDIDFELFYEAALDTVRGAWKRLGELTEDAGELVDSVRYQLPKLGMLERLSGTTRVSLSLELDRKARSQPEDTFFLHQGRAFTYADANRRVDAVTRGFLQEGVRPGQRVAVLMASRPSFLTAVTALNRLGAVSVILPSTSDEALLAEAMRLGEGTLLVVDPEHAAIGRRAHDGTVLALGIGAGSRSLPEGVSDMESIDSDAVELPSWYAPHPGHARDLAMVLFSRSGSGALRVQLVTNGRWATSAYGAAAGCTLTPRDTVYSCLPLQHPSGLLVAVGSAVVAGARLALGSPFSVETFWTEVHRYGATVAFYAGDMVRALVSAERRPLDQRSSLRLFAGSGMRLDVWEHIESRFGGRIGVMEFYASTEAHLVLANASGRKVGSLGRPLPGSASIAIAAYDWEKRELVRDAWGRATTCGADEPGLLLARIERVGDDPIVDLDRLGRRVRRDVFEPGDAWFITGDVATRDADGDYWYVDRELEVEMHHGRLVSPRAIEDVLHRVAGVFRAVALHETDERGSPLVAVVELSGDESTVAAALDEAMSRELAPEARPRSVLRIDRVPLQEGYRPAISELRRQLASLPSLGGVPR